MKKGKNEKIENEFLAALYSDEANPEIRENQNLFGQFVGEWEFEWFGYEPNKEAEYETGEWIFSWVLDGRVIQDLWIIPGRDRRNLKNVPKGEYGTTLRSFNENTKTWDIIWMGPIKNRTFTFEAKMIGNEIVMNETSSNDVKMKWIISKIEQNSFHWRSILSDDNGETWKLVQEMNVKRKQNK